jgi:septal ring factor EnvC (AmiA/AmiB activator)
MEWPNDAATVIAITTAVASLIVAFSALAWTSANRRRIRKAEETIRRIETGRTKALSSAEQLLSAMHRLAAGYRALASSLRNSATVTPDSVQEIAIARQEVERERAVAHL